MNEAQLLREPRRQLLRTKRELERLRQQQLEKLVDRAIARLDEGASQASLPAMSSYERKLVHDFVAVWTKVMNADRFDLV